MSEKQLDEKINEVKGLIKYYSDLWQKASYDGNEIGKLQYKIFIDAYQKELSELQKTGYTPEQKIIQQLVLLVGSAAFVGFGIPLLDSINSLCLIIPLLICCVYVITVFIYAFIPQELK